MRLFFDSCIVIYYIERRSPWHSQVVAAMEAAGTAQYCVSDLVRMECRTGALIAGDARLLDRYERFFRSTSVLPMTPAVFDRAAELRAKHRLKTPDALHLATAIEHGCAELWTNDARLSGIASTVTVRNVTES